MTITWLHMQTLEMRECTISSPKSIVRLELKWLQIQPTVLLFIPTSLHIIIYLMQGILCHIRLLSTQGLYPIHVRIN